MNGNKNLTDELFKQIYNELQVSQLSDAGEALMMFNLGKNRSISARDTGVSYQLSSECRFEVSQLKTLEESQGMGLEGDNFEQENANIEAMIAELNQDLANLKSLNH